MFLVQKSVGLSRFELLKGKDFEIIFTPFKINDFISKIKIALLKDRFSKKSFIKIKNYILDLNRREIYKNEIKLKLTEREVDLLMHLKKEKEPISINKILKDVWKYAFETQTHTVETHVHRLRKKFLEKFNDKIILNDKKGYYI